MKPFFMFVNKGVMGIRSFKAQPTRKQLRLFSKIVMAEVIGQGNEIILSKTGRGNELRKLRLYKNRLKIV